MVDPVSRQKDLVDALINYLTQETVAIDPGITWGDYRMDIASDDSPLGAVYVTNWMPSIQFNMESTPTDYEILIRLLIARPTLQGAINSAHAWGGHLTNEVIKKLQKEGYSGYFRGIRIKPKPAIEKPSLNQDGGGVVTIAIPCIWRDEAALVSTVSQVLF